MVSNTCNLFEIKHKSVLCMFGVQVLRKGLNNQGLRSDRQQLMDHEFQDLRRARPTQIKKMIFSWQKPMQVLY